MRSSRATMKVNIVQKYKRKDNLTSTHFSVKASVSTSVRAGTIVNKDCDPRDKLSRTTTVTLSGLPLRRANICSVYELFITRTRSSTSHLSCTQNQLIREQLPHQPWSKQKNSTAGRELMITLPYKKKKWTALFLSYSMFFWTKLLEETREMENSKKWTAQKCQGEDLSPTRTKSSGAEISAHSPPGLLVASPALRAAKPTDNHVAYLRNSQITNEREGQ